MLVQLFKATGILAKYVKYYWAIETVPDDGAVTERVIPTGNIDLIFHYRKCINVHKPDGTIYQQAPLLISGQNSSYVDVTSNDRIGMISVVFYPQTASLFFDFPLNIIENQSVNLKHLFKYKIDPLEESINNSNTLKEKIKAIEQFLLTCLHTSANKEIKTIGRAIQLINQFKGQINSTELANSIGISNKQLERKFASQIGKSPKKFIKIVRFQSVLASAAKITEEKLSNLAYDNGYFDQAHFINDFKNFTGYTPKNFFKIYDSCSDYYG